MDQQKFIPNEWSEEEITRACTMWREGVLAKDIALALGRTRNAIIGKMNRLKTERLVVQKPKYHPRRHKPKPYAPPPLGVSFDELEDGMCKWMFHSGKYCGHPSLFNRPWCATHAQKAARKAA